MIYNIWIWYNRSYDIIQTLYGSIHYLKVIKLWKCILIGLIGFHIFNISLIKAPQLVARRNGEFRDFFKTDMN